MTNNTITFTTDIGNELSLTEGELRNAAFSSIEFAVNDKEYDLKDLTADFVAEEITGTFGNHGMPKEGLQIIREELNRFE